MAAPETNVKLEDSKYNLVNNDYVFSVFAGFCLLGNVIKIYFGKIQPDGSSGPASATLWGYTIICFSLITILFVATTIGNDKPFEKLLSSGLPVMLLLLLLLWTISLNLKYYDKINKGLVAEEYYTWSRVSTTITIFQMVLIILIHLMITYPRWNVPSIHLKKENHHAYAIFSSKLRPYLHQ